MLCQHLSKTKLVCIENTNILLGLGQLIRLTCTRISYDAGGIGMTGTFPDGIINFPYLQTLTLTFGELEGPLPSFLGKLKNEEK